MWNLNQNTFVKYIWTICFKTFLYLQSCNAGDGSLYHGQLQACQRDEPHGQLRDRHDLIPSGGDQPDYLKLMTAAELQQESSRQAKWRTIQAGKLTQEWEFVRNIQTSLSFFTKEGQSYPPVKQQEVVPTVDKETWSQPSPLPPRVVVEHAQAEEGGRRRRKRRNH